jgi:nucleoside phosphorylase
VDILLTGVGPRNAEAAIRRVLARQSYALVVSSGFAGGLRPDLEPGTVVFGHDTAEPLQVGLRAAGAQPARFYCHDRVAVTAAEKRALRQATGADAVEMESGVIQRVCEEHRVSCTVVRVILDPADVDLPLDFNRWLTPNLRLRFGVLALAVALRPSTVRALRQLHRQSRRAAEGLSRVLTAWLGQPIRLHNST